MLRDNWNRGFTSGSSGGQLPPWWGLRRHVLNGKWVRPGKHLPDLLDYDPEFGLCVGVGGAGVKDGPLIVLDGAL